MVKQINSTARDISIEDIQELVDSFKLSVCEFAEDFRKDFEESMNRHSAVIDSRSLGRVGGGKEGDGNFGGNERGEAKVEGITS